MKKIKQFHDRQNGILTVLTIGFLLANIACNQISGPTCTIDVASQGAIVADICRGQQIEEFNHQIEGGLYAQLINNPSFDEIDKKHNNTLDKEVNCSIL